MVQLAVFGARSPWDPAWKHTKTPTGFKRLVVVLVEDSRFHHTIALLLLLTTQHKTKRFFDCLAQLRSG